MKNIKWGWYDDGSRIGRGRRLTCFVYVIIMKIQGCRYNTLYRHNNTRTKSYESNGIYLSLDLNILNLLSIVAILNKRWHRDLNTKGDITGHLERWRGWDRYIWFYICSLLPSARAQRANLVFTTCSKISSPPLLLDIFPCATSRVRAIAKATLMYRYRAYKNINWKRK